jgi:hypothetical protein
MAELNFPSGPWVGFYTYRHRSERFMMDLVLEFRNGVISGDGADGIGFFGIHGQYSAQGGECSWTKTYYGSHSVEYVGFREQKGIWGTWTVGADKGGFHIWPLGEEGLAREERADAERDAPVVAKELVRPKP